MKDKQIIGRIERINLLTLGIRRVPAKIDTGADSSVIWCSKIKFSNGELRCVLFGPESPFYTGELLRFHKDDIDLTRVANSFGHSQVRYKVKLPIDIKGRTIKATFTLADRSTKLYPVLIGRSTLQRKFLVDVSKGSPLREEEAERKKRIDADMLILKKKLKI